MLIAAQAMPSINGGLGHFIYNAVIRLADLKPEWQFTVVADFNFAELYHLQRPNLNFMVYNYRIARRLLYRGLNLVLKPLATSRVVEWMRDHFPLSALRARLGNLKDVMRELGRQGYQVVWLPAYSLIPHYSEPAVMTAARLPVVFTIHDIHPVFYPEDWQQKYMDEFNHGFIPMAHQSRTIVTHTQSQKQLIAEKLDLSLDKIAVTPIPPLMEVDRIIACFSEEHRASVMARFGIQGRYVMYPASNFNSHKNHVRLIEVWGRLRRELGEDCPTLVFTAKFYWPVVKALLEALDLQDRVVFTELVDPDSLFILYQNASLVAVPTLYEGGGSDIVAAGLLAGRPVACSDIAQIREQMAAFGCDVVYFNPQSVDDMTQTIRQCLAHLPELEETARRNQKLLLSSVDALWQEWARFYADVLESAAG